MKLMWKYKKKKIEEIWEIIDTESLVDGESFKESTITGLKTLASTGEALKQTQDE